MSSDINSFLNIDDLLTTKKFLFVTKDLSSDLNFVFGGILSHCIKKNFHITIVNLAQSYGHYTHMLLKSGVNIKVLKDSQRLTMVNVLSEIGSLKSPISETDPGNSVLTPIFSDCTNPHCLKPLYESIKLAVESARTSNPDGYLILIDEISLFLNLGMPLPVIQPFIQYCYALCSEITDIPGILLVGSFQDSYDADNMKMTNYLSYMADVYIHVECLNTGYSKDTNGKITLLVKDKAKCTTTCNKQFFKVGDKGAKLLTLGL